VYVRNSYGPASGGTVGARPLFGLRLLLSFIRLYVSAVALLRPTSCRVFLGFLPTGLRYTPPAPSRRPRGGALPPITKPTVLKALHPKLNYATIITGYSNHRGAPLPPPARPLRSTTGLLYHRRRPPLFIFTQIQITRRNPSLGHRFRTETNRAVLLRIRSLSILS
jgi:hypothetical protein